MPEAEIIDFQSATRRPGRRTGHRRTATNPTATRGVSFTQAVESWELALNARNRSADTIKTYRSSVRVFTQWLAQRDRCICTSAAPIEPCPVTPSGRPTTAVPLVADVQTEDVRQFLVHEKRRTSDSTAHHHFRNLRALYNWLIKEGDVEMPGPVHNEDAPEVHKKHKPPFTDDEVKKLLATCKGNTFEDLRDEAIMRVLLDIGPRVGGLVGLRYTPTNSSTHDVRLAQYVLRIRLKGGDEYEAPIGRKAAQALDRYIRRGRAQHPDADEPWLWLGRWGRLQDSGVEQMLKRRGKQAGVDNVHPHRFRRTAATNCLDAGQSATDVQHNFGWKTRDMVDLYTEETAKDRARRNHQRSSPADRF